MEWKNLYRDLKRLNWVILLLLASVSYFFMSNSFTTGVIIGGLMVIANLTITNKDFAVAGDNEPWLQRQREI